MAKESNKAYKIFLFVLIAVVSVSFLITYLKLQINIKERSKQSESISAEYEDLSVENQRLRDFLNSGDDAKVIEEYARNHQDFIFPDEYVYYDVTPGNN